MMVAVLPTRRTEAWKYSDLAAALPDVRLPAGADVARPIAALAGAVTDLRIRAGETIVDVERLDARGFAPRATAATVEAGAVFTRVVVQAAGDGVPLSSLQVTVAPGGVFRQFVYAEGGRLARIETDVELCGEGARAEIRAVYCAGAGRHADLTSRIVHTAAGGVTRQLVRGAVRAGGRGVFQGRILVAPHAQHTDAEQHHDALLLEDGAEVFAKPELEIHADDVQCAHGNTVGGLDAHALFYMRSRGVPEAEARALLGEAFLMQAVPDFLDDALRAEIEARIRAWLGGAA